MTGEITGGYSIENVYQETTCGGDGEDSAPSSQSLLNRYKNEVKHFLPYRKRTEIDQTIEYAARVDSLNCLQYVFFTWMTPVVRKIFHSKLSLSDINTCSNYDSCKVNFYRFKHIWSKQCKTGQYSLSWALFEFVRTRFLVTSFFYILCLIFGYLSSKLLEEIELCVEVDEVGNQTEVKKSLLSAPQYEALKWTIALFVCELFRAMSFSIMFAITIRTSARVVNALNGMIFDKILHRPPTEPDTTCIQPSNLFANDLWKVFQMFYMAPLVIGSPIIILVTIFYTIYLIGYSAIFGLILFVQMFILQIFITKKQTNLRGRIMKQTDHRISLIAQFMKFARAIKFNAWESAFHKDIDYCRQAETSIILRYQYLQCLSTSLALLAPMLITIINILVHTLLKHDLTVATAFSLVMLNYIAAHGIRSLPNYLREIVNGRIALKRIERFLHTAGHQCYVHDKMFDGKNAVELSEASFSWPTPVEHKSTPPALANINLTVAKQTHLCIYGPVGCGKSTLLLSILGQTQLVSGQVNLSSDRIAYVAQNPWLQNTTVRENILFGEPFEKKRYYETVIKCSLMEDFNQLAKGDDTVVGENGVQLSGGQKHRIALARAVYSNRDIYVLDDFFSSLDSRVAKSIFTEVIDGALKEKTVIFVTRLLYLLTDNNMVALINDGQITAVDNHEKLLKTNEEYQKWLEQSKIVTTEQSMANVEPNGNQFDELLDGSSTEKCSEVAGSDFEDDDDSEVFNVEEKNTLISTNGATNGRLNPRHDSYASLVSLMANCEARGNDLESGGLGDDLKYRKYLQKYLRSSKSNQSVNIKSISASTYYDFIRASGGWWLFLVMVTIFALQTTTSTFANWWLSYWLNQGSGNGTETSIVDNPNLHYYQTIYFVSFSIVILTSLGMGIIFARLVLRASNFLHGKVLTKVVKSPMAFFDTIKSGKIVNLFSHNIDELDNLLPVSLDGFLQRFLLVIGNFLIIIVTLYWFSLLFLLMVIVFVAIFRLYRKAMYWLKQADMRNRSPIYSFVNSTADGLSTIKAFRVEGNFENKFHQLCDRHIAANFLSNCAVRWLSIRIDFLCVFASVGVCLLTLFNLGSIGSAYAGLVITQSLQLSGLLQLVIRLALDLETRLVSVERVQAYIRLLKTENPVLKSQVEKEKLLNWPTEGRVSYRDVCLRYRKNLPHTLKEVSFDSKTGTKTAIVGRTGAGKSSITYALFRLVEIDSGSIFIDGVDIQSIPLQYLRSKLSIIPQDPVLFQGSIRKNLDPSLRCRDEELLDVIRQVKLIDKIPNGLDEMANEAKFSTGEKQLLCMARALLRKSQVIVFDEATSSVDDQTEKHIWEIIRNNFDSCTVILIAHRLQTVLNCDQVLVIKSGKVVECGNPSELLKNSTKSIFAKMVNKS